VNTNRRAKSCGKDGQKTPLEIASRFPLSHSFNNNKLDDPDHFLENPSASVASLRPLIGSPRNSDHDQFGMPIGIIGIPRNTSQPMLRYAIETPERYNRMAQGGQMADIKRISVQQAHAKTKANQALLVCAYEDEAKCRMLNLDGSISFASLQSRAASLPKAQEIIFY
jgi:hypothetical protein